jgi:hypothetical protein
MWERENYQGLGKSFTADVDFCLFGLRVIYFVDEVDDYGLKD